MYPFPMLKTPPSSAPLRSMTVTLAADQVDRLECVVRSGAYASCDDIVREALELWIKSDAALPGRLHLPPDDPFRWHSEKLHVDEQPAADLSA